MNPTPANPYTLPTIDFIGGSTQSLLFRVYFYSNKRPMDLSSCTANFSIVNYVNKNSEPLVSKQMTIAEGDAVGEDVVSNILRVTLDPADTVNLPAGKYIYQITIRDVSGVVEIPDHGIMRIARNINKAFLN